MTNTYIRAELLAQEAGRIFSAQGRYYKGYTIRRISRLIITSTFLSIVCISPACGLQYERVPLREPSVLIVMRGPIVTGDLQTLLNFLKGMPSSDRIIGFSLDSPGGSVLEATKIADFLKATGESVLVMNNSECSSACFLLFAAGSHRFVQPDALIGVHSASVNGDETAGSMAFTTAMAREAGGFGVPPEIIGKLVETPPGRTTWLTPSDFTAMGVTVLEDRPTSPPVAAAPVNPEPDAPANTYLSNRESATETTRFQQGLADRRAWETWFNQLSGDFRAGAWYWSGQRSLPHPGSCYGASGQNLGDWTAGCLAAKRFLDPADVRRKSEPDYKAGWNSC